MKLYSGKTNEQKAFVKAFENTRQEMIISLTVLFIITIMLSFVFYFVEHIVQPVVFDTYWSCLVRAYSRYIEGGDGVFNGAPVTLVGRTIAFLLGIIGIAIVAIPAGLIGSGFMDAIAEEKRNKELEGYHKKMLRSFSNRKKSALVAILMVLPMLSYAQQDGSSTSSIAYLEKTFPKLTEMYRKELSKYPAHYVFAIDVSGTMDKYETDVLGSLRPFFEALPDRDRVDVIPFGEGALSNMLQYSGIIDAGVKSTLISNLGNFYHDPSFPDGFKRYTYVDAAVEAITKSLSTNRDYKVNIVVILTDFWNENPQSRLFTDQELEDMHDAFDAASNGVYTRAIALSLPVNPKAKNVLPQLKEKVFCDAERGLEIVPMGQNSNMIKQWFDQLKREIMVDKLRAVINSENRVNNAVLKVDIDIDGNTTAEIHWTPTKLYPSMKIDSTYLTEQGWYFKNNKKAYVNTRDSIIGVDPKLELGKIKNDAYFFHHLQDSLHMGIYLPTEYDDELKNLNIRKPIPATTRAVDKWIFTFFLPFWLTALIIVLIILYIIGVIKAIIRNGKFAFSAKITVMDPSGYQIGEMRRISNQSPSAQFVVGQGGTGGPMKCAVEDAQWKFTIKKVKSNPFLVFAKPYFKWEKSGGFVGTRSAQSGKLDYKSNDSVRLNCGLSRTELTHQIRVKMLQ